MRGRTLQAIQAEVLEVNQTNGWFDGDRTILEGHMLLVTEIAEASEAARQWGTLDKTYEVNVHLSTCSYNVVLGEGPCACPPEVMKPEGVGSEYADILVRLVDQCERDGIDLEAEYERKIAHNRTRGYMHGGKRI